MLKLKFAGEILNSVEEGLNIVGVLNRRIGCILRHLERRCVLLIRVVRLVGLDWRDLLIAQGIT